MSGMSSMRFVLLQDLMGPTWGTRDRLIDNILAASSALRSKPAVLGIIGTSITISTMLYPFKSVSSYIF
jgi:hypothetical protein